MSEEEREKIMKEHEANMIRLENSLTLNKLRQRQLLDKKLAERRAKRLEELEQQQLIQTKVKINAGQKFLLPLSYEESLWFLWIFHGLLAEFRAAGAASND